MLRTEPYFSLLFELMILIYKLASYIIKYAVDVYSYPQFILIHILTSHMTLRRGECYASFGFEIGCNSLLTVNLLWLNSDLTFLFFLTYSFEVIALSEYD